MTILMSSIDLTDLRRRLTADGYSRHTVRAYVSTVHEFLRDLAKRDIALDTVDRAHDWRAETLSVTHTKTRSRTILPLR
jgi:hypothetical protein